MDYKIFESQKQLQDWVKCYWTLDIPFEQAPTKNTIIPDGTMKLIFHYGDAYKHHPNEQESFVLPHYFLIGQLTKPYIVEPLGETGTFMVCFKPNGLSPFTNISIKDIQNTAIPLSLIFGEAGENIGQHILKAQSTEERITCIEAFLLNQLSQQKTIDNVVNSTVETIFMAQGKYSIQDLSKQTNINRRQLARKFSSTIGLSPKQLSKTVRIQNALKTLLNKNSTSLTELAYENEYYDQAHFIKDFKEFTGLTPKEFYGDDLKMSLIFDQKE